MNDRLQSLDNIQVTLSTMMKRRKGLCEEPTVSSVTMETLRRFAHMWASLVEGGVTMISVYGLLITKRLLGTSLRVMIHKSGGLHGLLKVQQRPPDSVH